MSDRTTVWAARLESWCCLGCQAWNAAGRSKCADCGRLRSGARQIPREVPPARREAIPRVQTRTGAERALRAAPRDRTPRAGNKAEAEWIAVAARLHPGATIIPHGLTLAFPDGDRYTVDLLVSMPDLAVAYEVKGGYRGPGWEQGYERYKRAKAAFPWMAIRLAEKRCDGLWYVDGVALHADQPGAWTGFYPTTEG